MNNARDKLTICGSFGFRNAGDEAIPEAISDMLAELGQSSQLNIVGRFDKTDMPEVITIAAQDAHRRQALKGDPVIMSGGGIIEEKEQASLFRCNELLQSKFTAKALLLGVSVEAGVRYSLSTRYKIYKSLNNVHTVYTRDVLSEKTFKKVLPYFKTKMIGDLVLWHKPDASQMPKNIQLPSDYIAVCLAPRWQDEPAWLHWIANELLVISRELKTAIVFVPMSGKFDDDQAENDRVAGAIQGMAPDIEVISMPFISSPRLINYIFSQSQLVISMRLHGCVMAFAQQVPFVAIAYHPKLYGFTRTVNWSNSILPSSMPNAQAADTYGYNFLDVRLAKRDLVNKAIAAIGYSDFSLLNILKAKSLAAMKAELF